MQKKAIGTSDFKQSPAVAPLANKCHGPCKLSPQYRFGSQVIGVTVRLLSGEILCGVITFRVEGCGFGLPDAACPALQNVAAIQGIEKSLFGDLRAGGTIAQRNSFRHAAQSSIG